MAKKNRRIIIVANGMLEKSLLSEIQKEDYVIGVDRATFWLLKQGIVSDVAVGDFDSCTQSELIEIKKNIKDIQSFSSEKNFTDTELAVEVAIGKKPSEIVILGGSGSRLDHTIGTIFLLEKCLKAQIAASIRDEGNIVTLQGRGRTILEKRKGYMYVSIIPITDAITISLEGFRYPLSRHTITRGQTLGISNEFSQKRAVATLHTGRALIIQSSD